jgi:hypothetical protein
MLAVITSVRMRWEEHVSKGRMRNAYKMLVVNPEGKGTHVRERNIGTDLLKNTMGSTGSR